MSAEITDAFQKMLAAACPPQQVRAIEAGESPNALWGQLHDSGFADALVPEARSGSGLTLHQAFPLLVNCGAHALPLPLGYTMLARALLADAGVDIPPGPVSIGIATPAPNGVIHCSGVSWGLVAQWLLVDTGTRCLLLPTASAKRELVGTQGSSLADVSWERTPMEAIQVANSPDLRTAIAAVLATHIAGAMLQVLRNTVAYANERKQFGKPIGRFQAVQQQLSVMAEQTFAAHAAAEMGCLGRGYLPAPLQAAVAKARSSEAVPLVTAIAHAVHGAVGVTYEFDLHLLTRRLHEWRLAGGAETYWHHLLGSHLLQQEAPTPEFIHTRLAT
jgi:acyl-CoA dehydrogenase